MQGDRQGRLGRGPYTVTPRTLPGVSTDESNVMLGAAAPDVWLVVGVIGADVLWLVVGAVAVDVGWLVVEVGGLQSGAAGRSAAPGRLVMLAKVGSPRPRRAWALARCHCPTLSAMPPVAAASHPDSS